MRTLAWLGDAIFEAEVRLRLCAHGDLPVEILDRLRTQLTSAEAQARLAAAIEPQLDDTERGVLSRARNSIGRSTGRKLRDVKSYRAASGLEALIAHCWLAGAPGHARLAMLLSEPIDAMITSAVERPPRRPQRG